MDPDPELERIDLIGVDRDITVHVLHSFFSVPVGPYSTVKRIYAFSGDLTTYGLLPVTGLPVASFSVWCAVGAVPREYHIVPVEDISSLIWKKTQCKRAGKGTDSQYLAFR